MLNIPTPCQENWVAMTPDAQGRFCTACQKSVVDFTRMTDQQVAEFFQNKKEEGRVCARIQTYRLGAQNPATRRPTSWAATRTVAAAFWAGMLFTSCMRTAGEADFPTPMPPPDTAQPPPQPNPPTDTIRGFNP